MNVYFVDSVVNKPMSVDNMVIIEYQDGMENWGIPYFEGMQSVKMPVLTTTGKNLFDGELELGAISDGINQNWREYFRSKNFIPIKPNTAYGLPNQILIDNTLYNGKYELNFYDDNKKYIGKVVDKICITPPNAKFMRICYFVKQNFIVTLDMLNGTQIYLYENGTTNDEFEPYKSNILHTPEEVVLRSLPGGVCDTLNLNTGEYVQRIGEYIITGDETWSTSTEASCQRFAFYSTNIKNIIRYNGYDSFMYYVVCDKLRGTYWSNSWKTVNTITTNNASIYIQLPFGTTMEQAKALMIGTKIQYKLETPVIKTVDLSDNVVYSYKDTTHYTCSSEDGSLIPTLTIEEGVRYEVIIKPSTKYSIVFNRTEVASGLTVDLGGATTSVTSSTLGKNIAQITTPSTLSHNYVIFKGLGNAIKDVQVIEGEVVGDEPYFEGMVDVDMPVAKNVGKNLFDGEIELGGFYGSTGLPFNSNDRVRSKNKTLLRKGTYTLSCENAEYVIFSIWSLDGKYIREHSIKNKTNTYTFDTDALVNICVLGGDLLGSKILLEENTVATSYEPYKSNTISTNEVVLRSLPNGVCDTLDLETGEYVQRIGEVVLDNSDSAHVWNSNSDWSMGDVAVFWSNNVVKMTGNSILCDKFPSLHRNELIINNVAIKEAIRYGVTSVQFFIRKSRLETPDVAGFKRWLSQNPVTVQYELATPITITIDLKQHPFAYKDGYVVLTSSGEEISLTPTIEYSLIANRLGQIQSNQKLVEKQQAKIDELESMVITNLVNTQYQQALNEIKLGVK